MQTWAQQLHASGSARKNNFALREHVPLAGFGPRGFLLRLAVTSGGGGRGAMVSSSLASLLSSEIGAAADDAVVLV